MASAATATATATATAAVAVESDDAPSTSAAATARQVMPSASYATLNSQFSIVTSTGETDLTFLPAHTAATLCSLAHYPPTVTQSSNVLSSMLARQPDNGSVVGSPTSEATVPASLASDDMLVTVPVHAPVYAGHLKTLVPESNPAGGSHARWYRREFRFDGRLLCCLDAQKCRAPPDTLVDHPQQVDKPHWPTHPYPTPALNSPLLATPAKTASYLAGNQEPVKYFQRLLWSLPISDIEGIEMIRPPASAQGVIDAALNAVSYARRRRQRARERCLVLKTVGGNVRVLRTESVRDLQRWAYILTQAWAMYVWLGKARETVNELTTVSALGNPSTQHLPFSATTSTASLRDAPRPLSTSTPVSSSPTHSSGNPSKARLENGEGERTYLSREDAMAHVKQSFVHIENDKDAEKYQMYRALLQGEHGGKTAASAKHAPTKPPIAKTKQEGPASSGSSSSKHETKAAAEEEEEEEDDASLADSMRALNGEHQRYSQRTQRQSDNVNMDHVLPAALMGKALDMADQEEAERKQRLQAMATSHHGGSSATAASTARPSAGALAAASGGAATTLTRRTSRPTRTSSTGRVRRGLSTLRRERRPRRVEVVLVDGDDRVLTRSSSVSQNNAASEPKLQARVARIQSTRGVIIRLSDPGPAAAAATASGTASTEPDNDSPHEEQRMASAVSKSTSAEGRSSDGADPAASDLKRRGAKRSPVCFGSTNGSSSSSSNAAAGSTPLRGAMANRSRSNSGEANPISLRKSVTIAGGPRVHTTDVDVVAPAPRSAADTGSLQRCAEILSHKPSDASLAKTKERSDSSRGKSGGERERSESSRHRLSHYAAEEGQQQQQQVARDRDAAKSDEKHHSHTHRSGEPTGATRPRGNRAPNAGGRWDDPDENWIDDEDEDSWYDRRSHRTDRGDRGHAYRRSYDEYASRYMSTLRGDIRGPPMPPPPPPPPMPPRAPGAHYPYYHDGAPGKAAHGAPHHRHHPPYDGMMHPYHPPPYPYPYGQHQQQQPFYPAAPRLSLGGDRSSTATFGSGHGDYRRTSSHGAPIDPYGAYSTELYPPPQSRRPADSMDRQDSRDRHDPSGGDSGQERNGGRKSMRIRRKESRS